MCVKSLSGGQSVKAKHFGYLLTSGGAVRSNHAEMETKKSVKNAELESVVKQVYIL